MNTHTSFSELELIDTGFERGIELFHTLYDKYSLLLYTLIKKILKDEKHAEEVLKDLFLFIYQRSELFDNGSGNTYAGLINLARNIALYRLREKQLGEKIQEYAVPKLSRLIEQFDLDNVPEQKEKIKNAFKNLSETRQNIICLAFFEGLTGQEIAERLKIPFITAASKIKAAVLNLNENFLNKPSLFLVKNEIIELIYPFSLGCMDFEEQAKTFNRFKAAEPFPWKLLGEYQNLISLLPLLLDLETPLENFKEKLIEHLNLIKNGKEEKASGTNGNKKVLFDRMTSSSAGLEISNDESETGIMERFERVGNLNESKRAEANVEQEKTNGFMPLTHFKQEAEVPLKEISEKTFIPNMPLRYREREKRNYTSFILIFIIVLFAASVVMAYLFYRDRILYYETQVENLNNRLTTLIEEGKSRPDIPGIAELRNARTVELNNVNDSFGSGKIIFSFDDRRGYLYIQHLPILNSERAYQLWGNIKGNFISLGVFKISSRPDYYPFTLPGSIKSNQLEFFVIESNAAGFRNPGYKVYLRGKTE